MAPIEPATMIKSATNLRPLVCVVDDDADNRDSLQALLEASGYAVLTFASAADYLHAPARDDIGCLLLDMHMPGIGGIELIERLRERGDETPAILLTVDGRDLSKLAEAAGAIKGLHKPVNDGDLLLWIERAMGRDPLHSQ